MLLRRRLCRRVPPARGLSAHFTTRRGEVLAARRCNESALNLLLTCGDLSFIKSCTNNLLAMGGNGPDALQWEALLTAAEVAGRVEDILPLLRRIGMAFLDEAFQPTVVF